MPRTAAPVTLSDTDRLELERWVRAHNTPQQVVLRSRIVLLAAAGRQDLEVAKETGVNRHTAALWRHRFRESGLDGLWEIKAGRGRKLRYGGEKVAAVVGATLSSKPEGSTHWSCRTMAPCPESEQSHGQPHLAGAQPQAAPGSQLQTLP
jgi:hypothetical protein